MRLPRFRVRTLMMAVAIAGLMSAGVAMTRRRIDRFSEKASWHREQVAQFGCSDLEFYLLLAPVQQGEGPPRGRDEAEWALQWDLGLMREFVTHHQDLENQYELASRRPWLSPGPDPPEPPRPPIGNIKVLLDEARAEIRHATGPS